MLKLFSTARNDTNFYLSGILSFFIYILVFTLFLLYIDEHDVKLYDSSKKTTVLELEVVLSDEKQNNISKMSVNKKVEEDVAKKSVSNSPKQKANIKSLFANVDTKEEKVVKEVVNNVKSSNVSSRFKSKFEREKKTSGDLNLSKMLDDVKMKKRSLAIDTSSEHANDPYFSKIHEILAQRWNPIMIDDGLSAKVLIIISKLGNFNYKFLKYSTNEKFDTLLKEFLEEQKNLPYPPHNKGSSTTIEVTFKSKG